MDTCPPFSSFFGPFLRLAGSGEINVRDSAKKIADQFGMTTKARLETTRGGNQPRYINRTYWVASYFRKAGLVETSKRGYVKITKRGKEFLNKHRGQISSDDINSFSSFTSFKERKTAAEVQKASDNGILNHSLTPHDRINDALQEIEDELAQMILEQLQSASPSFFERAVLDLFLNMGYGSSNEEAGELLGGSGDNGVDGLINQDALGLERVYIQAKRYQSENNISADAIREFTGALNVQQASKGLFVTTSSFSKQARTTAEKVPQRIVLIDGKQLAQLMIKYNVGCSTQRTFFVKQLDTDYFE